MKYIYIFLIILLTTNCTFKHIKPLLINDEFICSSEVEVANFRTYQGFEDLDYHYRYDNNSYLRSYSSGDHILFSFIRRTNLMKYKYYEEKSVWDDYLLNNIFILIDTSTRKFEVIDSIYFDRILDTLFSTRNFKYFYGNKNSIEIWHEPIDIYKSHILLFNKLKLNYPKYLTFSSQEVIRVDQIGLLFRVITIFLKPELSLINKEINKIIFRQPIGEFKITGRYKEYLYNQDLELVSEKEIKYEHK